MTYPGESATDSARNVEPVVPEAGHPSSLASRTIGPDALATTPLLGLRFDDRSLADVAESLVNDAQGGRRRRVFFVNAHCVNVAASDEDYASILRAAPALYADGVGLAIAGRVMNAPLQHNVNGTDLLPVLCRKAAEHGVPIALLGGKPGIAERCARALEAAHPGLEVAWHDHGYHSEGEELARFGEMNDSGARILLVAKGVPKQEKWIDHFGDELEIPVILGVGALFDFYSGSVRRAPLWVRRLRCEWVYRLALEPGRLFGRYVLGNPAFLARLLAWRAGVKPPWAAGHQTR